MNSAAPAPRFCSVALPSFIMRSFTFGFFFRHLCQCDLFTSCSSFLILLSYLNNDQLFLCKLEHFSFCYFSLLISKNSLLILVDLFATINQCFLIKIKGRLGTFERFLGLKFLYVFSSDGFFNFFHLLVTFFHAILLHLNTFLLSQSACPNFNIVHFFVLGHFECFLLTAQHILVKSHDGVIVKVLFTSFQFNDPIFANLFDTTLREFVQHFSHSELHLCLELLVEFVLLSHRLVFFLLLLELDPSLILFDFTLLGQHLHFLLKITLDQILVLAHLLLQSLHSRSLFVKFLKYFLENSRSFTTLYLLLSNLAKCDSEFVSEIYQILWSLHLSVKLDSFVGVVNNSDNKTFSIALEQEPFNLFPISKELKGLLESGKSQVVVECFGLLQDTYG